MLIYIYNLIYYLIYYFNIICFDYFLVYIASILRSDLILYNCFMLTIDVEDNVYHTQEYEMDLHARFNPFSKLNLGRAFLHDVWNLRKQL